MKISLALLFIALFQLYAIDTYSQDKKLNVKEANISLRQLFKAIEKQSEFLFFFVDSDIDGIDVTVNARDASVTSILNQALSKTKLTYEISNRNITIFPDFYAQTYQKEVQQGITITGTVTDNAGEPMPGVNVLEKGTLNGVVTDANGKYSIVIPNRDVVLVYSFVGYATREYPIGDQTNINIVLGEDTREIEEVVVVGYGTQKKGHVSGSIASINNRDLNLAPTVNISNNLVGRIPGLITNTRSGEPGNDDASILIRGKSTLGDASPLVVIDGVADRGSFARLDPNDIENISVLKDASAAIYGARSANGVILVTTKRGKTGKPTINYTMNQGFIGMTRRPKVLDSYQFALMMNEMQQNDGKPPFYTEEDIQKYKDGSSPLTHPNTDWIEEVYKDYSTQNRQNLSVSGGSQAVDYYLSLGLQSQNGINYNSNTNYKQYNFRANIDTRITQNINVGFDAAWRQENYLNSGSSTGTIGAIISYSPTDVARYPNGLPGPGPSGGINPLLTFTDASGYRKKANNYINSMINFEVLIPWVVGLSVDGFVAYDHYWLFEKNFRKPYTVYNYNQATGAYDPILTGDGVSKPDLSQQADYQSSLTPNVKLNYKRTFGNHGITAFLAFEQNKVWGNRFNGYRKNYLTPAIDQLYAGDDLEKDASGSAWESARRNYFGRLSYMFREKYLLDFNFRYDGSENFPKDKRYGFFPGVSVAWRLSEENFMKQLEFINHFKIRASYGEMGNDRIAAFQYLTTYSYDSGYVLGETPVVVKGVSPNVTPNPNITWEVAKTINFGLDMQLFNELLGMELDVFDTKRSNILWTRNASVPSYTGINLPSENIGKVNNRGVEVMLTHRNRMDHFTYYVNTNMSFARNKIEYIDEAPGAIEYQKATGYPMETSLYYNVIGIFESQQQLDNYPHQIEAKVGDYIFEDYDKDGIITSKDMIRDKRTSTPEIIFGLTMGAIWKNFDLNMLWQGQTRAVAYFSPITTSNRNTLQEWYDRYWRPGKEYEGLPAVRDWTRYPYRMNAYLVDATFLRLKSLELGYNFNPLWLERAKISGLRIYISGFNLLTFDKTGIKSIDPENTREWGNYYPLQRIYNIGVNLKF